MLELQPDLLSAWRYGNTMPLMGQVQVAKVVGVKEWLLFPESADDLVS